ncbi:RNA-binding protein [Candidatus Aerophobetes bacterium]|uniref:RNA-binding protein n=1 Tax=Aerophobetes bacterium TaxID=2030807 RepID=A0A497E5H8_UNCAE|nr:MAG: RNA-binding protein [Candidatus Aerophobetes bacterium]
MCLSTVYVEKKGKRTVVMEEAAQMRVKDDWIEISQLLGETKRLEGYQIEAIDFLNHFVVLKLREAGK